jgi:putative flavoprotein involved in K+ transport
MSSENFDVIVVGGGQAGLAAGYQLRKRGLSFVILEAGARVGDAWRKRWDSLRLFTPAALDGLEGMPFPAPSNYFPTKDEMGDYLESYARHFDLPVRLGVRVERLSREGDRYVVDAGGQTFVADHVVVATGGYQRPRLPKFSVDLDAAIVQLHSSEYKNPGQLTPGPVLIVGAGNSGADIAMDLAKEHAILLSGRPVGEIPVHVDTRFGHLFALFLLRIVFHRLLTVFTPWGKKARPVLISRGGPLVRQKDAMLLRAGVERVARIAGAKDGRPVTDDGRTLAVTNVIWCTGFRPNFEWIDLPEFVDEDGEPHQHAGISTTEPGIYFVGLHFQYAMSSMIILGVSRDAAHVVGVLAKRLEARRAAPPRIPGLAGPWAHVHRRAVG